MRSLPNMTVISPADPLEQKATSAMIDIEGPVYVRLGKNGEPNLLNENYNFEIGKGVKLRLEVIFQLFQLEVFLVFQWI